MNEGHENISSFITKYNPIYFVMNEEMFSCPWNIKLISFTRFAL